MMANSTTLTLSRGEKHVVELGKAEEGRHGDAVCGADSTLCPSQRRPLNAHPSARIGQVLRYSIFAEGSTDVIVHFDVDGVESTQRTLKCDCTLLPKVGSFLIRRAGRLHFTIENDNLIRSKVVQYKVGGAGHQKIASKGVHTWPYVCRVVQPLASSFSTSRRSSGPFLRSLSFSSLLSRSGSGCTCQSQSRQLSFGQSPQKSLSQARRNGRAATLTRQTRPTSKM